MCIRDRSKFPVSEGKLIDSKLEKKINQIRSICSLALSIRKKEKLKVRQPLNKIIIPVKDKYEKQDIENAKAQIISEINVKSIEFLDNKDSLLIKELKPNFKVLGPKYGAIINSCLLYTSPSPRDREKSRMPSSA